MKLSTLALTLGLTSAFASTSLFASDTYKCFLDSVAYKKSPIVTVTSEKDENGKMVTTLEFLKNSSNYARILTVEVKDNSEDVLALFESKDISLSFYLDEGDAMGFMEGTITSPVMNGDIKCILDN